MSLALKCDRCGVCFDVSNGNGFEYATFPNPTFTKVTGTDPDKYKARFLNEDPHMYIDLCPGCTQEFEKFMTCEGLLEAEKLRNSNAKLVAEMKAMASDRSSLREENDRLVDKLSELKQKYDDLKNDCEHKSRTCRRGGCRK